MNLDSLCKIHNDASLVARPFNTGKLELESGLWDLEISISTTEIGKKALF